jgi:hypothetical protein
MWEASMVARRSAQAAVVALDPLTGRHAFEARVLPKVGGL